MKSILSTLGNRCRLLYNPNRLALLIGFITCLLSMVANPNSAVRAQAVMSEAPSSVEVSDAPSSFANETNITLTPTPSPSSFGNEDVFDDDDDHDPLKAANEAFAFEALFQPPWSTAITKSLFGYKTNPGAYQLSTYLPHYTTSVGMSSTLCTETFGGIYNPGLQTSCFVKEKWTQLVSGYVEEGFSGTYPSMRRVCEQIGGIPFGSNDEFCAVKGQWTQLTSVLPRNFQANLSPVCDSIGGVLFGKNNAFCVVEGYWSQFTSRFPDDHSWPTISSVCEKFGGRTVGIYFCILEGVYSQLSTRLPDDRQWPTNFPENTCNNLGGTRISRFCFVKGTATQLTVKLPGDTRWQTNFPESTCNQLGGDRFSRYCFVNGDVSQLSTKLPGDTSWQSNFNEADCNAVSGITYTKYCFAAAGSTQFTTRFPGQLRWTNFPAAACENESFNGATFSRYCAVPSAGDQGSSVPSAGDQASSSGTISAHMTMGILFSVLMLLLYCSS